MEKKHNKLTRSEFAQNFWTDCADSMTGRFSAPFILGGALITLIIKQYDLFWAIFLCALAYSSYKQVEKERNTLIALEKKYDNREIRQVAIDKLWELRQSGSHLRNMGNEVKNEDEYKKWKAEYEQWRIDILREADLADPNLQKWNHTVNVMDISKMPGFTSLYKDGKFVIEYMIICENLNRIEEYLKRELCLKQETYFR